MSTLCEKDVLRLLCDEQWSNAACCGYLIYACEKLGYNNAQIDSLLISIEEAFNRKAVDQAKKKYYDF